jgi:hypothetical protein
VVSAATSGCARILAQSKPGWFGSTVMVAGSVSAHSLLTAVWPRRAPATAVRTVMVAKATSKPTTIRERHRRRESRRSQVRVIRMPAHLLSQRASAAAMARRCDP